MEADTVRCKGGLGGKVLIIDYRDVLNLEQSYLKRILEKDQTLKIEKDNDGTIIIPSVTSEQISTIFQISKTNSVCPLDEDDIASIAPGSFAKKSLITACHSLSCMEMAKLLAGPKKLRATLILQVVVNGAKDFVQLLHPETKKILDRTKEEYRALGGILFSLLLSDYKKVPYHLQIGNIEGEAKNTCEFITNCLFKIFKIDPNNIPLDFFHRLKLIDSFSIESQNINILEFSYNPISKFSDLNPN